ncbi:MAG: 4Fe-4S binding protein [Paracoccaceae bacterium]
MATRAPTLILCDCEGSFRPDAEAVAAGTGIEAAATASHLCGRESARLADALGREGEVIVACAQMAETFAAFAEDVGSAPPLSVDFRDRAGWTDADGLGRTGAKQAALIAAARLPVPQVPLMDVESGGLCLVLGATEIAAQAAGRLADALSVTALSTDAEAPVDQPRGWDLARGRVRTATGALGRFSLTVDGYAGLEPAGRGAPAFGTPRDGAATGCDVILDLTGGTPLFPAHHKRDGYLRADPRDPAAVARAVVEAREMVGTFEKPLHIRFTESLCAHQRAGQTGCTRCLSVCPTGAIAVPGRRDAEAVVLDPHVCAGCGGCAAVCPSGAAMADDPPVEHLFRVMRVMAETYRAAGGEATAGPPRLLIHDEDHGAEMVRLAARHGEGLPADVIPLAIRALSVFGHAEAVVALGLGYAEVTILASPGSQREQIEAQIALAEAVGAGAGATPGRLRLIEPAEPDALAEALRETAPAALGVEPILASGGRRDGLRLAAKAIAAAVGAGAGAGGDPLPLPEGAPYGAVLVDTDACTLCMSCAGLCPTGAILDNPDRPELSFREEACIQCGICATVCPEDALRLEPRLDLSDAAFRPRVLNEEEPFACIECGTPFGVRSTIERIVDKLQGRHAMFTNSDNVRLIQMCDDCRVKAQFRAGAQPFAGPERPRPRTTDDYKQ